MAPQDPTAFLTFGELVVHLREEAGMSRRALARRSGLAYSHTEYIEKDAKSPSDGTLEKLATSLSVHQDWLIDQRERRNVMHAVRNLGISKEVAYLLTAGQPYSATEEARIEKVLSEIRSDRGGD